MENMLNNPHEEVGSDASITNSTNEEATTDSGSIGSQETSPEAMGLEDVANYNYEAAIGVAMPGAEDVESSTDEAEVVDETSRTIIDEEASFLNPWFASYDDEPSTEIATEGGEEIVLGADDRVRITATNKYPWRAICSLIMRSKTGKTYIGTGWFVSARTVITAGHCIYFHKEGGWAESITVIPGRNGGSRPYGSCVSRTFKSVNGWTKDKGRNYDYGAIILPANCRLGERTGSFGYAYMGDDSLKKKHLNLSGYPGDKPAGTQWFHSRGVKRVTSRTIVYNIDTAGGQSGSPVWYIKDGKRYSIGIHTNGHSSGNSATRIVKPVFENIKKWKALGK